MVDVTFRTVTWDERTTVRGLVKRCGEFVSTYDQVRGLHALYDKGGVTLVEVGGVPAGFSVVAHNVARPWSTIHEIGVAPEFQSQGIGNQFIGYLIGRSPHHCLHLVCDQRNEAGLRFYLNLGFKALGVRPNRAGDCIVDMALG